MRGSEEPLRSALRADPSMGELVDWFVRGMPEKVEALRRMSAAGDAEGLSRIAHQLKGCSAGFGFDEVGLAAGRLERAIDGGSDAEAVGRALQELLGLCVRVSG